jgi:hypothetical protein
MYFNPNETAVYALKQHFWISCYWWWYWIIARIFFFLMVLGFELRAFNYHSSHGHISVVVVQAQDVLELSILLPQPPKCWNLYMQCWFEFLFKSNGISLSRSTFLFHLINGDNCCSGFSTMHFTWLCLNSFHLTKSSPFSTPLICWRDQTIAPQNVPLSDFFCCCFLFTSFSLFL